MGAQRNSRSRSQRDDDNENPDDGDEDEGNEENQDEDENSDDDDDDEGSLSQAEVDQMIRRAKTKARRAARRELLKTLGLESVEELQELIAKAKNKPASKNSKADDDDDSDAEAKAEEVRKAAERSVKEINLTRKVEGILVDKFDLKFSQAKRIRKLIEVDTNADDDEIEEAIEDLQADMPSLFDLGGDDDEGNDEGESGRNRKERQRNSSGRSRNTPPPRSPGRRKKGTQDVVSTARTLLHERHPHLKK